MKYTEGNNPANLQYKRFLNIREGFMYTLHDFKCRLLSVIVKNVELTVQFVETKGNTVHLTTFSC